MNINVVPAMRRLAKSKKSKAIDSKKLQALDPKTLKPEQNKQITESLFSRVTKLGSALLVAGKRVAHELDKLFSGNSTDTSGFESAENARKSLDSELAETKAAYNKFSRQHYLGKHAEKTNNDLAKDSIKKLSADLESNGVSISAGRLLSLYRLYVGAKKPVSKETFIEISEPVYKIHPKDYGLIMTAVEKFALMHSALENKNYKQVAKLI